MRTRILIVTVIALTLAVLLTWQWQRGRLVDACQAGGGHWNCEASRCEKPRGPILQRDLQRT